MSNADPISPSSQNGDARRESTTLSHHHQNGTNMTESTPLLSIPLISEPDLDTEPSFRGEVIILATYSLPIVGTHLLEFSMAISNVITVGQIGVYELAGSSIAIMTASIVALSVIIGAATALDTLCPQAYTSSDPRMTSTYALRTLFIITLLLPGQWLIFYNSKFILIFLRQEPRVAELAESALKVLAWSLPGFGVFEVGRRWLQAQGMMSMPTICLIMVSPLNAFLCWLLVWGPAPYNYGFIGAPLATAISYNLMGLLCLLYCVCLAPRTAYGGFSRDIFRELGINAKLGLAGFAVVVSDWWAWEIMAFCASLLGPTHLAAQSITGMISALAFQIPFGIASAASVRTGNLVGAGKAQQTRTAARAALVFASGAAVCSALLVFLLRKNWAKIFSRDEGVIREVASILPFVSMFQIADGITAVTGGIFRGVGRASTAAVINVFGYYALGLPLAIFLAFSRVHMGLYGLWLGITVALLFTGSVGCVYVYRLDYEAEVIRTRRRMEGYSSCTPSGTVTPKHDGDECDELVSPGGPGRMEGLDV